MHVPDSLGTRLISSMAMWEINALGGPMGRCLFVHRHVGLVPIPMGCGSFCASGLGKWVHGADSLEAMLVLSIDNSFPGFNCSLLHDF